MLGTRTLDAAHPRDGQQNTCRICRQPDIAVVGRYLFSSTDPSRSKKCRALIHSMGSEVSAMACLAGLGQGVLRAA